jgi:hypothetical protein
MTAAGTEIHVLAIACRTHPGSAPPAREREFDEACTVLGVRAHHIAWMDTDRAPGAHLPDLVQLIESGPGPSLAALEPDALLIPSVGSFHLSACDRVAAARARKVSGGEACALMNLPSRDVLGGGKGT